MQALASVDYGVIDEGVIIVCNLCSTMKSGQKIKDIPGIVFGLKIHVSMTVIRERNASKLSDQTSESK